MLSLHDNLSQDRRHITLQTLNFCLKGDYLKYLEVSKVARLLPLVPYERVEIRLHELGMSQ
jgi:hypothetical protein